MTYPTYDELCTKIQDDYDISDENFVSASELVGLFNEGIKDCERIIHELSLEDKYFLMIGSISLVAGTADYTLPADIYAHKLRHLWYQNGSIKYEIKKMRDLSNYKFSDPTDTYEFILINLTTGPYLRFLPTPAETGSFIKMLYVRECRRLIGDRTDTDDTLELPNGENLILQHVRRGLARKTRRPELLAYEEAALTRRTEEYEASLKEMIPDENNLCQMDLSAYCSQGLDLIGGF